MGGRGVRRVQEQGRWDCEGAGKMGGCRSRENERVREQWTWECGSRGDERVCEHGRWEGVGAREMGGCMNREDGRVW